MSNVADIFEVREACEGANYSWRASFDPEDVEGASLGAAIPAKPCHEMARWARLVLDWPHKIEPASTSESRRKPLSMDAYWEGPIRNRRQVLGALEKTPKMHALLAQAQERLRDQFSGDRLVLEGDPDGEQIYVVIETSRGVDSARVLLEEFDHNWWLASMGPAQGNMSMLLRFV